MALRAFLFIQLSAICLFQYLLNRAGIDKHLPEFLVFKIIRSRRDNRKRHLANGSVVYRAVLDPMWPDACSQYCKMDASSFSREYCRAVPHACGRSSDKIGASTDV